MEVQAAQLTDIRVNSIIVQARRPLKGDGGQEQSATQTFVLYVLLCGSMYATRPKHVISMDLDIDVSAFLSFQTDSPPVASASVVSTPAHPATVPCLSVNAFLPLSTRKPQRPRQRTPETVQPTSNEQVPTAKCIGYPFAFAYTE